MKKIRSYFAEYWYRYVFIIICMCIAIALDMLYPMITKDIVNKVFLGKDFSILPKLLFAIAAVGVGRAIFGYLKEYTADSTGAIIGKEMRKELFDHIQGLSLDYFHDTNTGELMARLKDDIDHVWGVMGFFGIFAIEIVIHVTFVIYCMLRLNWKLTIIPLITMSVCGFIAVFMERKMDAVYEEISEENAALTTVAEENLAGVRTVKAFAREKFEIEKFLSHNSKYYELNMKQAKTLIRFYPVFQFVGKLLPVVTTVLGGVFVIRDEMDLGSLVAFVEYSRNCTWPMENLGWLVNEISSAIASRKKIRKIFEVEPTVKETKNPEVLAEVKGKITFDHVSFSVKDTPILTDISFELEPGKTLGIMGATGSGKTTIINLLQRFYDATKGRVLLDDVDVKNLRFDQLRGNVSCVMQDVFLFSDTIEENIKMGRRQSMEKEHIKLAAKMACADDFIERMDESYETVIGERGVGLSGGQKQRISIARALSKETPVLVFDDSTSALDMETEKEIQNTLKQLKDITKVIVAHRISAVRHADEILFLKDGKVAERGTHEQLMAAKGLYYETYQAQYGLLPNAQ